MGEKSGKSRTSCNKRDFLQFIASRHLPEEAHFWRVLPSGGQTGLNPELVVSGGLVTLFLGASGFNKIDVIALIFLGLVSAAEFLWRLDSSSRSILLLLATVGAVVALLVVSAPLIYVVVMTQWVGN